MNLMLTTGVGGMGGAGGMAMGNQTVNLSNILTGWNTGPFAFSVPFVLVAIALLYLRAARDRSAQARDHAETYPDQNDRLAVWSRWRSASFMAGLAAIELALGSSVATLAASHFPAHIFQHLLLMMIAPPLLALGAPMTLMLQTSSRATKRRLLACLHSRAFAAIAHPIPVFFLYYGSMFAFFLSPALGFAMDNMDLMDVINIGFFLGATLFWWPMVGLDPVPRWNMSSGIKILNLLIGVPFESFLAVALLMEKSPVASMYSLASIHTGGGVLWVMAELLTAAAMMPVFVQWSRADARLGRRIDARIDAGMSVEPVAIAGHGLANTMKSLRRG